MRTAGSGKLSFFLLLGLWQPQKGETWETCVAWFLKKNVGGGGKSEKKFLDDSNRLSRNRNRRDFLFDNVSRSAVQKNTGWELSDGDYCLERGKV